MRTLVHNLVGFARENAEQTMVVENLVTLKPPETDDAMYERYGDATADLFPYGTPDVSRHEKKR